MSWKDFAPMLHDGIVSMLGETVVHKPKAPPDSDYELELSVDPNSDIAEGETYQTLFGRAADFQVAPLPGDLIEIDGTDYRITRQPVTRYGSIEIVVEAA